MHACNPSTQNTEANGFVSLKSAWSTEQVSREAPKLQRNPATKKYPLFTEKGLEQQAFLTFIFFCLFVLLCFLGQGFSVTLEPVLELAL